MPREKCPKIRFCYGDTSEMGVLKIWDRASFVTRLYTLHKYNDFNMRCDLTARERKREREKAKI